MAPVTRIFSSWSSQLKVSMACVGLLIALSGCGSDGDGPTGTPDGGTLEVTTSTTGADIDPDGYTITVGGMEPREIGINATVTFEDVEPGDHMVELSGMAANCSVAGENPRQLTVEAENNASVAFEVSCSANVGDLEVTVSTTGEDIDEDGYSLIVGGSGNRSIDVNGSTSFADLAAGEHTVELAEFATNCAVSGENPRSVEVEFGGTATIAFEVTCATRTGTLQVATSTSGDDPDPDGYTVTVDGGESQEAPVNGTIQFTGLSEGEHTVELSGVATNCSVQGDNPRTVEIPFEEAGSTTYEITCSLRAGDLEVTAATSGDDVDPDGYTVTVDGEHSQALDVNGTVTFEGLAEGDRTVELGGVDPNCSIAGENPRTVTIEMGATASTTFELTCTIRTGTLEVHTETSGDNPDDGYVVVVDGSQQEAIGANATITLEVSEGDRTVALTDLATNCGVDGENPRTVTVVENETASTTFQVSCWSSLTDHIVFESNRDGNSEIYVMNADGSAQQRLTNDAGFDRMPALSPDGNKIAFASNRDRTGDDQDIFVMNPDGSGVVNLTNGGANNWGPAWSPDGEWIAFTRISGGDRDIYLMRPDGSETINLMPAAGDGNNDLASWAPDSRQIAFMSDRDGDLDIYVMEIIAGSEAVNITQNVTNGGGAASDEGNPAWAPDGSRIAFTSDRDGDIELYVADPDGANLLNLTGNAASDGEAAWSPDASSIVFVSDRDGFDPSGDFPTDIYIMDANGQNVQRLTDADESDLAPTFRSNDAR